MNIYYHVLTVLLVFFSHLPGQYSVKSDFVTKPIVNLSEENIGIQIINRKNGEIIKKFLFKDRMPFPRNVSEDEIRKVLPKTKDANYERKRFNLKECKHFRSNNFETTNNGYTYVYYTYEVWDDSYLYLLRTYVVLMDKRGKILFEGFLDGIVNFSVSDNGNYFAYRGADNYFSKIGSDTNNGKIVVYSIKKDKTVFTFYPRVGGKLYGPSFHASRYGLRRVFTFKEKNYYFNVEYLMDIERGKLYSFKIPKNLSYTYDRKEQALKLIENEHIVKKLKIDDFDSEDF